MVSEKNKTFLNKKIVIFYHDNEKVSRRDGICTFYDCNWFILDENTLIPVRRIVRVEIFVEKPIPRWD